MHSICLGHAMSTLANSYSFCKMQLGLCLLPLTNTDGAYCSCPRLSGHRVHLSVTILWYRVAITFFSSSPCEGLKDICLSSIYLFVGWKEEERGEKSLLLIEASWSFASWTAPLPVSFGWTLWAWDSDGSSQFLWSYVNLRSLPKWIKDSRAQLLDEWAYLIINSRCLSLMRAGGLPKAHQNSISQPCAFKALESLLLESQPSSWTSFHCIFQISKTGPGSSSSAMG